WFGLTHGWYWIRVGETVLFRYTRAVLAHWAAHWARQHPGEQAAEHLGGLPYVDYQVAHLWSDLLDLLPYVLAPLPPRLALVVSPQEAWMTWQRQAEAATRGTFPDEDARDLLYKATRWWFNRWIDSQYLVAGPQIVCWSDGEQVHVQWDNRDRLLDGI